MDKMARLFSLSWHKDDLRYVFINLSFEKLLSDEATDMGIVAMTRNATHTFTYISLEFVADKKFKTSIGDGDFWPKNEANYVTEPKTQLMKCNIRIETL